MTQCDCEDWDWHDENTGCAICNVCDRKWYVTPEQMQRIEEAERAFEKEMEKGRPCIRCDVALDATPGGHVCSVTDAHWIEMLNDDMLF